jgi:hypothetical protein
MFGKIFGTRRMTCICVLGMHRSGTSCLTGILQQFGVELGDVFTENLYNKKGNRENNRIVILNDAVLATNGGAWNDPVIARTWTSAEARERDAIIKGLGKRSTGLWGFKDPRALFTLPFWLEAVEEPKFIGTFRHPQRVALSLQKRDGTPLAEGWELWRRYNERLLELSRHYNFALANFDLEPEAYLADTLAKLVKLGLDPELANKGQDFFDSSLRSQADGDIETVELPADVAATYKELQNYYASWAG